MSTCTIWVQKSEGQARRAYKFVGGAEDVAAYWRDITSQLNDEGRFLRFLTCDEVGGPTEEVMIPMAKILDVTLTPKKEPGDANGTPGMKKTT